MKMWHKFAIVFTLVAGCGVVANNPNYNPSSTSTATKPQSTATAAQVAAASTSPTPTTITLSGYVESAFQLTVNGQTYSDSETFYTQEMTTLQQAATAAGYGSYTMTFDAQIGLDDLANGMEVYVVATGATGYAGNTTVNSDGSFNLTFPYAADNATYQVKATKRIDVHLHTSNPTGSNPEDVYWCYNFSAVNQNVQLQDTSKPIILNAFTTELTQYQCSNVDSAGITIPPMTNTSSNSSTSTGTGG